MIFRINKTKNYTVMSNAHLQDHDLSLKAKGLLSMVLSLPDNWDYSISGLAAISKENETAIKSTLTELKESGYLTITKKLPNETSSGRFEYVYDFFETKQEGKKQGIEILPLEILPLENQPLQNTNIINTKKENTEKKNIFLPPTIEEVYDYCESRHNGINPQLFIDYYTAKGWKGIYDWKAMIRAWENNQKKEE